MVCSKSLRHPAFTIVELLVVIVVIGILAGITIISYTGITNRAIASSLQSDLTNASKQLDLFQVEYGYYPSTIDCTIPNSTTNQCLKTNPTSSFTYLPGLGTNPTTYTLTATHTSSNTNYTITTNSPPIATAPENPVADWLAMPRGAHYGNFYDLVSKQYATVTRATPKTIYDPLTNKIYDVPANTIGVRPRSDGKAGYEAEVEGKRTNYAKGSSFEIDTNFNGVDDNWKINGSGGSYALDSEQKLYGLKSQKITKTIASNDIISQVASSSIIAGETFTYSVWVKGEDVSGSPSATDFGLYVDATGGTDPAEYGVNVAAPTGTFDWTRISVTKTFTYNHTSQNVIPIFRNKTGTVWFDCFQVEKGSYISSYIPTTASSVTRGADFVRIPTDGWSYSESTIFIVGGGYGSSGVALLIPGTSGFSNRIQIYLNGNLGGLFTGFYGTDGVGLYPSVARTNPFSGVFGTVWKDNNVKTFLNGSFGSYTNSDIMTGLSTIAYIGDGGWPSPISRLSYYNSSLSDSNISAVTNNIKDGPTAN